MKENFLHFVSDTPCIININGKNIGSIDNKSCMELDIITKTNHLYVTYEPITLKAQALPYTIMLNTNNTPTTESSNTRIVPFPNNNYDIIMSPFYFYHIIDSKVQFNGNIGKYFVSVVSDTATKVIIYSGLTIVFSTTLPKFKTVKVEESKNVITIQGIIDDNTYYLLALNSENFEILYNDFVHSIEINSDNATLLKSINTLCHHAEVYDLNFVTKQTNQYYVFEENFANMNVNPLLIPQAFLECVKISDEKTAKQFLSTKLQSSNINKMREYFGDIKEIYFNRHQVNPHKLNYTIMTNTWRNFNFVIDNNKICEIEEISL